MEITLQGKYKVEDFRRAVALNQSRSYRLSRYVTGGIAGLVLLAFLAAALLGTADSEPLLLGGVPVLLTGALFAFTAWGWPRMQANQLSMSPLCQGTVSGLITWQTIALQTEAGEYEWDWAAFVKHRMSGAIILLYRSQQAMIVLPRSLVASDDDWQRLQDHVQATVPARTPWRPSYAFWMALGAIILGLLWGLLGLLTE